MGLTGVPRPWLRPATHTHTHTHTRIGEQVPWNELALQRLKGTRSGQTWWVIAEQHAVGKRRGPGELTARRFLDRSRESKQT